MTYLKRIFYLFVFLIMFFCFTNVVFSADYSSTVSRNVEYKGRDDAVGGHKFDYLLFGKYGKIEGSVVIPDAIYNQAHWFLGITKGKFPVIYTFSSELLCISAETRCFYTLPIENRTYSLKCTSYANTSSDFSLSKWVSNSSYSYMVKDPNYTDFIEFQNIIYTKDLGISIFKGELTHNPLIFPDETEYVKPTVSLTSQGIRIYLHDIVGKTFSNDVFEDIRSLTRLSVYLKDPSNLSATTSLFGGNALSFSDVQEDGKGYYIDLPFSFFSPFMDNSKDFEYVVRVYFELTNFKHYIKDGSDTTFDQTSIISGSSYVKYSYKKNTNSGILILVDKDGNEIDLGSSGSGEQPPKTDPSVDALKGQTDAINNQTNKIEEQTNAIKESHETSKNIFQKIIDLPREIISGFLDMLKGLFIPSDDFLGNFFNDLYNWFCDRLGFLSYPLQLFVDILNRFLSIDFEEPIINIPDINESITNNRLISATNFNFNKLLENPTLKRVHDIYLILVDSVIIFGLVNLAKNKLEEVTKS